jgi:Ran GTPase-activating protein (RanGAP) involved in mRNA processing and transport
VQRGSKVTSVRAAHCGIGSAGAVALGAALAGAVNLCLLDVSWNRIGRSGALAIATGLRTHPSVLEVRMECNGIGAGGVEALAAPLTSNTVLERIYVVGNTASRAEKLLVEAALLEGREGVRGAAAGAVECYV